jgi:hypothetical protein
MIGERFGEPLVGTVLGELGKRFEQLLLGVIDILQLSVEQLFHRFHGRVSCRYGGSMAFQASDTALVPFWCSAAAHCP